MSSVPATPQFNPSPNPGLSLEEFRKVSANGFGDPFNSYPHSMQWFDGHVYVGTTRANLCLKHHTGVYGNISTWPIECPENWYDLGELMCAQIWRYNPEEGSWENVFTAPMTSGREGESIPRDMGYRGMAVFKGKSDLKPALYVVPYSPSKGFGPTIIRSQDGKTFESVSEPGIIGLPITTMRSLVPFKDQLFVTPAGRNKGRFNTAGDIIILASKDPAKGEWFQANEMGLGGPGNQGVFELAAYRDHLYAGTIDNEGFELWRTRAEGKPPYTWEKVLEKGCYRGSDNQTAVSMIEFKGAFYIGTGIQHGGFDVVNHIGPAAPEIIRLNPDDSWDLIVGQSRDTPDGFKRSLSGFTPGFNNFFNSYFWRMEAHEGWLYMGSYKWSTMLRYADPSIIPPKVRRVVQRIGVEHIVENLSGLELYRSYDGENWLPVTLDGFGNYYNVGLRSVASTPYGLFLGVANPFAPKVAVRKGEGWGYESNDKGGLEIWLGHKENSRPGNG